MKKSQFTRQNLYSEMSKDDAPWSHSKKSRTQVRTLLAATLAGAALGANATGASTDHFIGAAV